MDSTSPGWTRPRMANTHPLPNAQTPARPAWAPRRRPRCRQAMLTAVMACGHSSRGTGSITEEFHAGVSMAVQHPPTNTSSSTVAGGPSPAAPAASAGKAAVWAISAPEMRRRRSLVSANTPAGRASKTWEETRPSAPAPPGRKNRSAPPSARPLPWPACHCPQRTPPARQSPGKQVGGGSTRR